MERKTKYICLVVLIVYAPAKDGATKMKTFLTSDEMDDAEAARAYGETMMKNGAVAYRVKYRDKPTELWVCHEYVQYEPGEVSILPTFRC